MENALALRTRRSRKRSLSPDEQPTAKRARRASGEPCPEMKLAASNCLTASVSAVCPEFSTSKCPMKPDESLLSSPLYKRKTNTEQARAALDSLLGAAAPFPVTPPHFQTEQNGAPREVALTVMAAEDRSQQQAWPPLFMSSLDDELHGFKRELLRKELKYKVDRQYMARHPSLSWAMRSILLDWLTEVCALHQYCRQTFYLCIVNFDCYMSRAFHITPQQLQLVGCACLLIAAKMEEVCIPHSLGLAYLTEGGCSAQEILACEQIILKTLAFMINPITPHTWVDMIVEQCVKRSISDHVPVQQLQVCYKMKIMQLLDIAVLDERSLDFSPHVLAAAASHIILRSPEVITCMDFSTSAISSCLDFLLPFASTMIQRIEFPAPDSALLDLSLRPMSEKRRQEEDKKKINPHIQQHHQGLRLMDAGRAEAMAKGPGGPPTPGSESSENSEFDCVSDPDAPRANALQEM